MMRFTGMCALASVMFASADAATCQPSTLKDDAGVAYTCEKNVIQDVNVHWRYNAVQGAVSMAVTGPIQPGWIGLTAAGTYGRMGPASGPIGYCTTPGQDCKVETFHVIQPAKNVTMPVLADPSQKLLNSSIDFSNNVATLRFARMLTGAGGLDLDADAITPFNFASNPTYPFAGHKINAVLNLTISATPAVRVPAVTCQPSTLKDDAGVAYTCEKNVIQDVNVHWRYNAVQGAVSMAVTGPIQPGWIGLTAAGTYGRMGPASGPIGYCTTPGQDCKVETFHVIQPAKNVTMPVLADPSQKLLNSSIDFSNNVATLRFARMLTGAGGLDLDADAITPFNFASNPTYPFAGHKINAVLNLTISAAPQF